MVVYKSSLIFRGNIGWLVYPVFIEASPNDDPILPLKMGVPCTMAVTFHDLVLNVGLALVHLRDDLPEY